MVISCTRFHGLTSSNWGLASSQSYAVHDTRTHYLTRSFLPNTAYTTSTGTVYDMHASTVPSFLSKVFIQPPLRKAYSCGHSHMIGMQIV